MKLSSLQESILDLATEDLIGFWEIVPSARKVWPGVSGEELRARISTALLELLRMGIVEFYVGSVFSGEQVLLPGDRVAGELSEPLNWDEMIPTMERGVRVTATESGRERYLAYLAGD